MKRNKRTEPAVTKTFRVPLDLYSMIEADMEPDEDFSAYARQALREMHASRAARKAARAAPPTEPHQQ